MRDAKGFNLIELMVVIAIIGVIATIAVPNYLRHKDRARQSEAKQLLGSLFTAETAFFSEWTMFTGDFGHIGFSPEGDMRYNIGFTAVGRDPTAMGNFTGRGASGFFDTEGHCGGGGLCLDLSGGEVITNNQDPSAATPDEFIAAANGDIDGDSTIDNWIIDQAKSLRNGGSNDLDD